ncbi:MAG: chemotaxis protein CheW, partial [Anaerolineales bacterium]
SLANESYGLDIADVEGIIKMQAITTLPQAPAFVVGVISLRGKLLPVVDLRKRLGLPQEDATIDTRIIVVDIYGAKGRVVDSVSEVLNVPVEAIEPPSPVVTTVGSDFIKGIAKVEDRLVNLLDLAKALAREELLPLRAMPDST